MEGKRITKNKQGKQSTACEKTRVPTTGPRKERIGVHKYKRKVPEPGRVRVNGH